MNISGKESIAYVLAMVWLCLPSILRWGCQKMFLVPQFNKVLSCKTSWSKFPNENPTSFLVKKCFESFQLPPQPTNYPTNQLTKYSLNHLPHHPTIQIFNHPQQPSLHSAFHPSNQFTIQVSNHPSITPCPGSVGRLSPLTTFLVWITVCPGSCGFLLIR